MNETESFAGTFQVRTTGISILRLQEGGLVGKRPVIPASGTKTRIFAFPHLKYFGRIRSFAETGAFWGAVGGLFIGCAFFEVPGDGPLLAAFGGLVLVGGVSAAVGFLYSYCFCQSDFPQAKKTLGTDFASCFDETFFEDFTVVEGKNFQNL